MREKENHILYASSYTTDYKVKGYISTLMKKEYGAYTNNAKEATNVNQYDSSTTKRESNIINSTSIYIV